MADTATTHGTPSTAVQAKAATYLLTRRVRIDRADQHTFTATVTGTRPYAVGYHAGGWHCTCPASRVCAHITACQVIWQPTDTR